MGEPMRLAFGRGGMDERRGKREVAPVVDVVAKIPERFDDSRRAQHGRPHRRARDARPRFDRRAENGDRLPGRLTAVPRKIASLPSPGSRSPP